MLFKANQMSPAVHLFNILRTKSHKIRTVPQPSQARELTSAGTGRRWTGQHGIDSGETNWWWAATEELVWEELTSEESTSVESASVELVSMEYDPDELTGEVLGSAAMVNKELVI